MTFSNAIDWVRRDGPRWENLGITYSAGTGLFSITAADGTALSASNAGYVTIPSKASPGQQLVYRITANQTFTDDNGTSTIIGNLFGLTTGIAYTQDAPFFIYAVSNDAATAVNFMISRIPHVTVAPAAANIGKTGSAVADTQGSFFALGNPTVGDYDGNPCICIGAFRMRMSASDDWTVQTLTNGSTGSEANVQADGIGCFHEGTKFFISAGQFGAATGSFFAANGGTAPIWSTQGGDYTISRSGVIEFHFAAATNSTAGVGAVQARLQLPYQTLSDFPVTVISLSGYLGVSSQSQANRTYLCWDVTTNGTGVLTGVTNAIIGSAASLKTSATYIANVA